MKQLVKVFPLVEGDIQDFLDKHPYYHIKRVSATEKSVVVFFEDKTEEIQQSKKNLYEVLADGLYGDSKND